MQSEIFYKLLKGDHGFKSYGDKHTTFARKVRQSFLAQASFYEVSCLQKHNG